MGLLIFPCVLASGESTLDSEGWSEVSEPWLWWRGNLSASPTWLQRWNREKWIRVLSTRTFFGSLGTDTEAWWISSVADSHVNRSQFLVVEKPPKTKDTSGLTSNQGLLFSTQRFVSLRTSMESLLPDPPDTTQFSTMSSATWNQWVIEQRQDSSQRRKLAHPTSERDGSSWPTPDVTMRPHEGNVRLLRKGVENGMSKDEADAILGRDISKPQGKLEAWPTPTVAEGNKISNTANYGQKGLSNHPSIQGTPQRPPLNKSRGGLPDLDKSSTRGKSQGQLNPDWVDQLMGFPVGWTDLEPWVTR
jgi:hypothetical protein